MQKPSLNAQTKAMLAGVWAKNRDLLLHRLDTIESFCRHLPESAGDLEMRHEAASDAHKLAGSLGMFGLAEGTAVAREIEHHLNEISADEPLASLLPPLATRLRNLVEHFQVQLQPAPPPRVRRVLILESDHALADSIAKLAAQRGLETRCCFDLDSGRNAIQNDVFDLLILDLATAVSDLKGTDDSTEHVRDLLLSRSTAQVLILTSNDTAEDRVTAAQLGAHGFLPRTVPVNEIVATCENLLALQSAEFKVLAVCDDSTVLETVKEILEQHSIRLGTVSDPRLFWDALQESAPDLVILDLEMPNFSGLDLCRAIRRDSEWNRLPVVFLSASSEADTVTEIFSAGADDFVAKPIIAIELSTRVRNRLDRDRLYRNLSDFDQLTNVRNRRSSNVVIANYLRLAERHGLPLSLVIIDLDKFKRVNDTYGHQAGDDVLQHLGALLRQSFRSEDVVARWGGEEFVVAMFAMRRADAIERMAYVLEHLEDHEFETSSGTRFHVSFSAGLAEFPIDGKELHTLYRLADEALYRAKETGGRKILSTMLPVDVAARTDIAIVSSDLSISASLRHALEIRGHAVSLHLRWPDAIRDLSNPASGKTARAVLIDETAAPDLHELITPLRAMEAAPAIFLLGHSDSSQPDPAFAGVEYISRPHKSARLLQRLRRVLTRNDRS